MFKLISQHCCKILSFHLFLSTLLGAGGVEKLTERMKQHPESGLLSFALLSDSRIFLGISFYVSWFLVLAS